MLESKQFHPFFFGVIVMAFCFPFLMNNTWLLLIVYPILIYLIYRLATWLNKNAEKLTYNSNYLVIKTKIKSKKIKLQNIKRLKLTTNSNNFFGLNFKKYRIEYQDEDEKLGSITFWSGGLYNSVYDFKNHLKRHSPETTIEFYSTILNN